MTKRIKRVNQLLKQEISQLILKEIEIPNNILMTVTRVEVTPDLREGKVFISILPEEKKDIFLDNLNKKIYWLQQKINKRLKMKNVPKIRFVEETKTKEAARIEQLLEGLKKKEK